MIKQRYTGVLLIMAIAIHAFGALGMLQEQYKDWFVALTPFSLVVMLVFLLIQQQKIDRRFIVFVVLCFAVGFFAEVIGVNTGWLFGDYAYGKVLGLKLLGVPLLIGVNWFVVVFCSGVLMHQLHDTLAAKTNKQLSEVLVSASIIIDGALLATFFDFLMEPVAIKLGYWTWTHQDIPIFNYLCWFVVSALLLLLMRRLKVSTNNLFATHLLIIQGLFFLVLRIFL